MYKQLRTVERESRESVQQAGDACEGWAVQQIVLPAPVIHKLCNASWCIHRDLANAIGRRKDS